MSDKLKAILGMILPMLWTLLSPEQIRELTDHMLDWLEERAESSPDTWDDRTILPLCRMVREAYNLPDDDA